MSINERLAWTSGTLGLSKTRFVKTLQDVTQTDTKVVKSWLEDSQATISEENLKKIAQYFEESTGHGLGWWRYGEDAYSASEKELLSWAKPYFEREKQIDNLLKRASQYCTWEMKTTDFSVNWSEDAKDVFGFKPDINMMQMMNHFDDKTRADASQAILRCICLERDFFSVIFSYQQDSITRRILFYGNAIIDQEDGGREYVVSVRGAASDVSQMQISSGELTLFQSSLQSAISSGAGIISILDTEGAVSLLHGRMLNDMGISVDDYLRRTIFDLRGRKGGNDNIARALSGENFTIEVLFGENMVITEFSPIYKENSHNIIGLIAAVKNVYPISTSRITSTHKQMPKLNYKKNTKILESLTGVISAD